MAVEEGAAGALEEGEEEEIEEEGEETPGVGAIEIDVLGLTVGDKDGDEEIEEEGEETPDVGAIEIDVLGLTVGDNDGDEEEEGDEDEEAPGVGAIEIDVLGVTVGAVEMNRIGVEATGEDGAPLTEGADVTDMLGVAPVNATFLTTPYFVSVKYRLPATSMAIAEG